jgi:hypothetical protein
VIIISRPGRLYKIHPFVTQWLCSVYRELYRKSVLGLQTMEFIDVLDGTLDEIGAEGSDQHVRSLRQRIIAAQIRDSEISLEDETVIAGSDNFDTSVENVRYIVCAS